MFESYADHHFLRRRVAGGKTEFGDIDDDRRPGKTARQPAPSFQSKHKLTQTLRQRGIELPECPLSQPSVGSQPVAALKTLNSLHERPGIKFRI